MKQHLFKFAIVAIQIMVNAVLASGQVTTLGTYEACVGSS